MNTRKRKKAIRSKGYSKPADTQKLPVDAGERGVASKFGFFQREIE